MKPSFLLLIASLAANLVLAATFVFNPGPSAQPAAAAASAKTTLPAAATNATPTDAAARPAPTEPLWPALRTEDLDEYGRRLRAAGFPPKAVRALISWKIWERTQADRDAVLGNVEDIPYWKPAYATTPEQQARLSKMYRERSELEYKYTSGPEALADDEERQAMARRQFGNLSLDKLQQLTALQHDTEQLQRELYEKFPPGPGADAKAREALMQATEAVEREKQEHLARILTPAELEQYELRNAGQFMASNTMTAFRPTEEEFKAIYAIQKSLRTAAPDPNLTPAQRQEEYESRIAAALGPERALDYLEVAKAGSDRLPLLIARLDLPLSAIGSVNAVRKDISQRAEKTLNDSSLTAPQRDAQLAALVQEANEKLTTTLGGKRGYEAYLDVKGDWIRELQNKRK